MDFSHWIFLITTSALIQDYGKVNVIFQIGIAIIGSHLTAIIRIE